MSLNGRRPSLAIVVPCWRDVEVAGEHAAKWSGYPSVTEIVLAGVRGFVPVVSWLEGHAIKWCAAPKPSRGAQMNLGARSATSDVLLFHHVDSKLTSAHLDAITAALMDPEVIGGGFYRAFDERHPRLRWLEKIERVHNRAFGTIYGDQSVFVRREIFARIGGFAALPLMEDVEFSRRLRRAGKIALVDPPMRSSPQRQMEQGSWRTTWRNLSFLIAFRCGISAQTLHRWYYGSNASQPATDKSRIADEVLTPMPNSNYER